MPTRNQTQGKHFFFLIQKKKEMIYLTHTDRLDGASCVQKLISQIKTMLCLDSADQTKLLEDNYALIHLRSPCRCLGKRTQYSTEQLL